MSGHATLLVKSWHADSTHIETRLINSLIRIIIKHVSYYYYYYWLVFCYKPFSYSYELWNQPALSGYTSII